MSIISLDRFQRWQIRLLLAAVVVSLLQFLGITPARSATADLRINEVMVSNSEAVLDPQEKNFSDWIEIYNSGSSSVSLSGMFLSDDPNLPKKWSIPSGISIPAGGYLVFWADGLDDGTHTDFKLKHKGEVITLSDKSGNLIDTLDYTAVDQIVNIAYGRQTDGSDTWVYFNKSTPGASNNGKPHVLTATQIAAEPGFSREGGFYSGNRTLSLSAAEPGATIYYTLDGSTPDESATRYTGSINLTATTVVRARTYAPSLLPSPVKTRTYFINESSTLPVISIAVEPDYFFDNEIGIYVEGSGGTINYYEDWQRPIHFEFYEDDKSLAFSFNGATEIYGNWSRLMPMKSLDIMTGAQYGSGSVKYQIFEDKEIDSFDAFILRNSGGDYRRTMLRDAMMQELVRETFTDIDRQAYRPAIVFLNGQFWGIHNVREKMNEDYTAANHGADPNNIDFLRNGSQVISGDKAHFESLLSYLKNNNIADPTHYAYIQSQVDVGELMNYMLAQIYVANDDWPHNNIKFWRERRDGARWRWMLFDLDRGFNHKDQDYYAHDTVALVLNDKGYTRDLFVGLLKNQEFKEEFAQRFATHINITYDQDRVISIIDRMQATIAPEMPRHIARWKSGSPRIDSLNAWEEDVELLRDFARRRPSYIFDDINNGLNLSGMADLTINISAAGGGQVYIHSVLMPGDSFTGTFFRNIPIRLEADANPGYRFVGWQEIGITESKTTHTISRDTTLTAVFEPYTPPKIVINEIHYNPSPAQGVDEDYEFIELYNADTVDVDLTNFRMTKGLNYTFTNGIINPGEYIILTSNPAAYAGNGYQVFGWDPVVQGKLANDGETLRLKDKYDVEVDVVQYNDKGSWVTEPDGNGPSLELIAVNLENGGDAVTPSAYFNWTASEIPGGTPGRSNDDSPRVVVFESGNSTDVSEEGQTDSYEILLNTYPTSDVTITLIPDSDLDLGNGPGGEITLTFTPSNALTPQKVTVSAVNDSNNEGPHTAQIAHTAVSIDTDYNGITINDVTVNITDNDVPGVTLVESTGYTIVQEGGDNDTYTVVLESVPASNVVIRLSTTGELDLGNGPGASLNLTFTPGNARTPQTVTVRAVDDGSVETTETVLIQHRVSSSDGNYDGLAVDDILVQIFDNDAPGITFGRSGVDLTEGGPSDSYTLVLDSRPTSNVRITVDPDDQTDLGNGAGAAVVLTFTPGNAFTPQTVTVRAVDDNVVEDKHFSDLVHTVASSDGDYDGFVVADITANIDDNDVAGITITQTEGGTAVTEDGLTDTYQIVLDSVPADDVEIRVNPDGQLDVGRGADRSLRLYFTPANALIPQTVTVTAEDDRYDEGNHQGRISHSVTSNIESFGDIELETLRPDIGDNDTAGLQLIESDGTTQVTEGVNSDSYAILFDTVPGKTVNIMITPDNQLNVGNGAGVPLVLTIKPEQALITHTVVISAVFDGLIEGAHTGTITHTVTSGDGKYNNMALANVTVQITDAGPNAVTLTQTAAKPVMASVWVVMLAFGLLLLPTLWLVCSRNKRLRHGRL